MGYLSNERERDPPVPFDRGLFLCGRENDDSVEETRGVHLVTYSHELPKTIRLRNDFKIVGSREDIVKISEAATWIILDTFAIASSDHDGRSNGYLAFDITKNIMLS